MTHFSQRRLLKHQLELKPGNAKLPLINILRGKERNIRIRWVISVIRSIHSESKMKNPVYPCKQPQSYGYRYYFPDINFMRHSLPSIGNFTEWALRPMTQWSHYLQITTYFCQCFICSHIWQCHYSRVKCARYSFSGQTHHPHIRLTQMRVNWVPRAARPGSRSCEPVAEPVNQMEILLIENWESINSRSITCEIGEGN